MPFSLLLGGIVTGFLSRPELSSKWDLLVLAPGLYFAILYAVSPLSCGGCDSTGSILLLFLFLFYWYLVSLAGAVLGYSLRTRISRLYRPMD